MARPAKKKDNPEKRTRLNAMGEVVKKYGFKPYRAATICGVPSSTICMWLEDPEIVDFFAKKKGEWIQTRLDVIDKSADDGTWQAAAWRLERADQEEYGPPTQKKQLSGPEGGPIPVSIQVNLVKPKPEGD